jgi:hypothetical protein
MLWGELSKNQGFKVIENMAMLPTNTISNGDYILRATYLNRED